MNQQLNQALLTALAAVGLSSVGHAAALYTSGHGDLQLTYESGQFSMQYNLQNAVVDGMTVADGVGEHVQYAPNDLITIIPDHPFPRPAGPEWDFIGASEGAPLWFVPFSQSDDPDAPWLGISTEALASGDFVGDLTYALTSFNGPGQLSLMTFGPFGEANIYFQTSNGVSSADVVSVPQGAHAHFAWFFTAPGEYSLDITASGTLSPSAGGGGAVSDVETFTFWVAVPEPTALGLGSIGIAVLSGFARKRAKR